MNHIDGIAIRIRSPQIKADGAEDPGNYYCRKGFYALNAQAICDSKKRILWISTGHKGSTHDSLAFADTKLYNLLDEKKKYLYKHRLFVIGDSAYGLSSNMIVPYDNAQSNSMNDAFNYYHSRTRIHIECAFGEIIMRWGIFWRKLAFSLHNNGKIINACCHLHNFFIEERLQEAEYENDDSDFTKTYNHNKDDQFTVADGEAVFPLVTDNNEPSAGGRPRLDTLGAKIRNNMAIALQTMNLIRPLHDNMKYNRYGNIYMDG